MSRWDIDEVKKIAAGKRVGLKLHHSRATAFFDSREQAYRVARATIASLTSDNFSSTVKLRFDVECDVYGFVVTLRGVKGGWTMKLHIDIDQNTTDEVVVVVGFHPLEKGPLKTKGGMVQP